MIGIVVCSLISYALKFYFVLVFGSALFLGIAFSAYFTYLLALPNNYGYTISAKNSSNLMIAYATGEAVVSAFVGVLMSLIHPLMLFVSLLVAMIINRSVLKNVISILKECQEENEKRKRLLETEMEMEMKQQ